MKLAEHTEQIRVLIDNAVGNRLDAMGIIADEKRVEALTFTLFYRLAVAKMMEAHALLPEPPARSQQAEGVVSFLEGQWATLSRDMPFFNTQYPYHLMPAPLDLLNIINAFNQVETDAQVEATIWKKDDVLGWLYESYNNHKKKQHKKEGAKTEYHKVSIQSQIYTPHWVVKFLVDNSLGKLYLEMYPDSAIKQKCKIAHAPALQTRVPKPLHEIKLIDPATGSGNFLLYAFDLLYDLYIDQVNNYGAHYSIAAIPQLIIENNLHGLDLDARAVQLAQLGLFIKARRKERHVKIVQYNIISTDFLLPAYAEVEKIVAQEDGVGEKEQERIAALWGHLQNAHKFGSLIRLEAFENSSTAGVAGLQKAVATTNTLEAMAFWQLLTQRYDIAVANPPYTDSAELGPELKRFMESNYRQPWKFNSNLYAAFIKRCHELIDEGGKMALIHPLTFMYIKTFEEVRRFMLDSTHISLFVDYGLSNLFGAVMVDPAFYVLEKTTKKGTPSLFISLDQYTRTPREKFKKDFCLQALHNFIDQVPDKHNISLPQQQLTIIQGWPFIYWISDAFREKFKGAALSDKFNIAQGLATADNDRFVRFWWEVINDAENPKWFNYAKGGPYNKWFGNNWCVVNWEHNGAEIKNMKNEKGRVRSRAQNEKYYFKEGVTYTASGSKGVSFRLHQRNSLFDVGGSCIFPTKDDKNSNYLLALLNAKLSFYMLDCFNPTVNTQVGDLQRLPFVQPTEKQEAEITLLASRNIAIKQRLCTYQIIETNFEQNPLRAFPDVNMKDRLLAFFNGENAELTQVLLNEAIIDDLIVGVYELSEADRAQVEARRGVSIGSLPVLQEALAAYQSIIQEDAFDAKAILLKHLQSLPVMELDKEQKQEILEGFPTLYQSNNDLEEFCIRQQINPINVWYWFREARVLPPARAAAITLEFLTDSIRTLLQQDADGIIPLVTLPGKPRLAERLEQYCLQNGFTPAQYLEMDSLLGRPINEYLEHHFFKGLGDLLNLFMYLPKTPFIWHLSSGQYQGFEIYILIYKWNRDSLFKLRSQYISARVQNLEYCQIELQHINTTQAQQEKELLRLQLIEIEAFTNSIEALIAEGYDPKLDDGVGKNIAPLQQKGMLRAEVLKPAQLQKYLTADW